MGSPAHASATRTSFLLSVVPTWSRRTLPDGQGLGWEMNPEPTQLGMTRTFSGLTRPRATSRDFVNSEMTVTKPARRQGK